jgi:hypothetical protein
MSKTDQEAMQPLWDRVNSLGDIPARPSWVTSRGFTAEAVVAKGEFVANFPVKIQAEFQLTSWGET